ncbi:hypothetical protein [Amycolatopsis sp. NPDC051071]|uniref:hypothetical protein n=1 Tax=Amycolatopsis sp. NPDC051071 TaxID=3154637 RepID=UPI00342A2B3C
MQIRSDDTTPPSAGTTAQSRPVPAEAPSEASGWTDNRFTEWQHSGKDDGAPATGVPWSVTIVGRIMPAVVSPATSRANNNTTARIVTPIVPTIAAAAAEIAIDPGRRRHHPK